MGRKDRKEVLEDLQGKYRTQDSQAEQDQISEEEKKKILEDAYRKSNSDSRYSTGDCLAECCCEAICEGGCEFLCNSH